jgi:hypothetical protein
MTPSFDIASYLDKLTPDAPQHAKGLTIIPLLSTTLSRFRYQSLKDALSKGSLEVSEVSESGSVPNLLVINNGDLPVLIIDGEELTGAKQNRILNTSIMVDARGKLVVPVSCTEAGRWSYKSEKFGDSGFVAPPSVRERQKESVSYSLSNRMDFASDQGAVWDSISMMHMRMDTSSKTQAMRDFVDERQVDIKDITSKFSLVEGQIGLIAVGRGGFVAIDVVSKPEVYADLHEKLVLSYATEALSWKGQSEVEEIALDGQVDAFLKNVRAGKSERFKSPGMGMDHRVATEQGAGSALDVEEEVVHFSVVTRL